MKSCIQGVFYLLFVVIILDFFSCKHSPIFEDDLINIMDTMVQDTVIVDPPDTMSIDTMSLDTCNSDFVYFDLQILPILQSNCSFSGCHDASSAEDGVILESFESVMATAEVVPFDLQNSKIYEVLVENVDDRMPPTPNNPLSNEQIGYIAKWILQGAEDLHCDTELNTCPTDNTSFQVVIQPILTQHCEGCHNTVSPSGGVDLSNYAGVKIPALDGRLSGTVGWKPGFEEMPQGGEQLSDCNIARIESWIQDGAQDN